MTAIQLERLEQDVVDLDRYAQKLKRRGLIDRMKKILEKKDFLQRRLAAQT